MSRIRKLKQALRFLFPEIQLYELVQQQGFIAKKLPASKQSSMNSTSQMHGETTASGSFDRGTYQSIPAPSRQGRRPIPDPGQARAQSEMAGSVKELDQLFKEVERDLNRSIIGQQSLISDLVAAYKQGHIHRQRGKPRNVILLAGAAGTGKKTAVEGLMKAMHARRLTSSPIVKEIDLSRYEADEISGNFIQDMAAAFQHLEGTVMFSGMKEADSAFVNLAARLAMEGSFRTKEGVRVSAADYFLVFYTDIALTKEREPGQIPAEVTNHVPATVLQSIRAVAISSMIDHTAMRHITENLVIDATSQLSNNTQTSIVVDGGVYEALTDIAMNNKTYGESVQDWINKELIPVFLNLRARNQILRNDSVKILYKNDACYIETRSIDVPIKAISFFDTKESIDVVLEELNALTGLAPVKAAVKELIETVQINKLRSQDGGSSVAMALHMVFTGNPGTGKTTVARIIARILKSIGLLSQGQLVEVSRQDLVGQYVGSTAPKTMAKVNEALGGVLFIDEAYTLARHDHDIFGLEAIDTIVKAMEDHRDQLVVIIAGYTQEMEDFLRSNPGLRSRFPFIVEFPDYQPSEMLEILNRMVHANGFRLDENMHDGLMELFEQRQIPGRNDSGNGRLVRNLFEEAIRKQAFRMSSSVGEEQVDLQLLTAEDFGIGEREAFHLEGELAGIVGLDKVKAFVRTLEKQMIVDRRRKEAGVEVNTGQMINMIFSGNPGTGKTTMARLLANMFRSMGYLKKGHLVEVDRSDLVSEYVGQTAEKTKRVVESALGGVLFIDEAYSLAQDATQGGGFGKEAIDMLVRLIELHQSNLVVILAGYTEDMERFVQVNPGMSSRFPLQIEFPNYTGEEMTRIASIMVKQRGFIMAEDVMPKLLKFFERHQSAGRKDSGNGRLVRNTIEEVIRRQAERLADQPDVAAEKLNELTMEDFQLTIDSEASNANEISALEELEQVIGLATVKQFVRSLSAQIEVSQRRHELGLPKAADQTLHMVFKGNPGTGKTTIARILASRFRELGVLKADKFVETDRSGLVAGYVGQTALKTKEVIHEALGGVLFIDEAYALAEGDQFGQEAIDTLVKAMDDYRDQLIVIIAGYDQDMERLLDRNAGLRSRFPNVITFEDYSAEELLQISHLMLDKQGYVLSTDAELQLLSTFRKHQGEANSGNGRLVRNLLEKAIRNHALRISQNSEATAEELSTLTIEDFV